MRPKRRFFGTHFKRKYLRRLAKGNEIAIKLKMFSDILVPGAGLQRAVHVRADQFAQAAGLATVYDQFKIHALKVKFFPNFTDNDLAAAGGTNTGMPDIVHALDFDDDTPEGVPALLLRDKSKYVRGGHAFKMYFKPMFKAATQINDGTTTYVGRPTRGYLDCQNLSVRHYGFKWSSHATANDWTMREVYTLYISFRNHR